MKYYYPMNRLQRELQVRFNRHAVLVCVFGSLLVASMMILWPTHSLAADYFNPNGIVGYPVAGFPTEVLTGTGCTVGPCDQVIWFRGKRHWTTGDLVTTCVASILNGQVPRLSLGSLLGDTNVAYWSSGIANVMCRTDATVSATGSWFRIGNLTTDVNVFSNHATSPAFALSDELKTPVDVKTPTCCSQTYSKYDDPAGVQMGTFSADSVVVAANANGGFLVPFTNPPYTTGESITFALHSITQFDVFDEFFFEDVNDPNYTVLGQGFNAGKDVQFTFQHSFSSEGTYNPMVVVTNGGCTVTSTGAFVGGSCQYALVQGNDVSVVAPGSVGSNLDAAYPSSFSASKTSDVIVGSPVTFSYSLSANFCSSSSVSGKRLFLGFSDALAYADSGSILGSSMSGSLVRSFERTDQPYSDFFFPYIRIYCSAGTSFDEYLGGTLNKSLAQGISVYNANDVRFALPAAWLNGGGNIDFGAGTGTYFASDKHVYLRGEPVKLRWVFNEPFTVSKVLVYNDQSGSVLATLTGSTDITENTNHYATITYTTLGEYQPKIKVCSTSCTSSQTFYLGGLASPNPENAIIVQGEVVPLYINSGAILGTFEGTGGQLNTSGIFGLNALNFQGFGSTGNVFLDGAQGLLVIVIRAAIWVAEKLFALLSATAFFSFVLAILHPVAGTSYVIPATIWQVGSFSIPTPVGLAGTHFVVSYVSGGNSSNVTALVEVALSFSWFTLIARQFLFHKRH